MLSILIKKGHLTRRRQGRAFVYKATVPQGPAKRKMVEDLVKRAFQGSSASMLATVLEGDEMNETELEQIKQLTADYEKKR
jgi:predicted transcriptional regulator